MVGPLPLALAVSAGAALPAGAACRLALLLALDISSSVDDAEDRLQREGLAAALTAPEIVEVVLALPDRPVALSVFEWSGRYQQDVLLDWRLLETRDDIFAAASRIAGSRRSYTEFPTAIGYALGYAAALIEGAPVCDQVTIDVSGDGRNNEGFAPRLAYENFPLGGVTVNGLVIGGLEEGLPQYYRENVIKGPGAFVETAADFDGFERAMRRKLLREMEVRAVGALPRAAGDGGG
ncbi:DUF1194 domain-containing protein [Psychromarinibacter sp. C21-152]|uniref:DUF1194 domain-containing protein n=1 Tax=Psychromarinibacter sediminicola TaxID=3033385 RepID=A0AAE3NRV4_9RHOB|nr:DUF1194 domain-containing protein [Psychromarinibacter sediminicola]MDF0603138.1 DUF1194 domain-containing protein [Psychromarinibacter sediminicola]